MKVHEIITQRIMEKLKEGTVPWHKPWSGDDWPKNLVSRREYGGINVFVLLSMGYASPYWMTYNQAIERGGSIKKGEKGVPVVYWKMLEVEDKDNETKEIPFLRYYIVFNLEQIEGIEVYEARNCQIKPLKKCEEVVENMPKRPEIEYGMPKAWYSPRLDKVHMPERTLFERSEELYSTLFHELVHSTGHESRLNRKTLTQAMHFGSTNYSKEELIAEMGAAFLCGFAGIEDRTIDNSAGYVAGWLDRLGSDKRLVVTAAAQAQKAFEFITNNQGLQKECGNRRD